MNNHPPSSSDAATVTIVAEPWTITVESVLWFSQLGIDLVVAHEHDPYESGGTITLDAEQAEQLGRALIAHAEALRQFS